MLNLLIFSKNRACQLEMLIRSIKQHLKFKTDYVITVLYKETEEYKLSYDFLKTKNSVKDVVFVKETSFQEDFLTILKYYKYTCLLTDDSLFFRDVNFIILPEHNETFSFRLGYNTIVQDHTVPTLQPALIPDGILENIIYWNPQKYPPYYNYGYPYSFDGHIYLSENLEQALNKHVYKSTNDIEGILSGKRHLIDKIYSYTHSRLVNIPCNNLSGLTTAGAFHSYTMKDLDNLFMSGKNVKIKNSVPIIGSHQEIEFEVV